MTASGYRHGERMAWLLVGVVALTITASSSLDGRNAVAAEIRLRSQCCPQRPVVTLADVAEILAADPQTTGELAAIELFPSPSANRQRFVRVRQIQDALYLRGVNLTEHQFSGSSQVVVSGGQPQPEVAKPRPLSSAIAQRAQRYASRAVAEYLRRQVPGSDSWKVNVTLDEDQARQITAAGSAVSVEGGTAPWTGKQRFQVTVEGSAEAATFVIDAEVSLPAAVVVAARGLARGTLISLADVRLQPVEPNHGSGQLLQMIDQAVGQQTTRSISEGQPLNSESVRQPLLVRRGDVVTVFVRTGGIRVRTTARARDDGSLGELVAVESMLDRNRYFASVSGLREVEVFARAVQAEPAGKVGQSPNATLNLTHGHGGILR